MAHMFSKPNFYLYGVNRIRNIPTITSLSYFYKVHPFMEKLASWHAAATKKLESIKYIQEAVGFVLVQWGLSHARLTTEESAMEEFATLQKTEVFLANNSDIANGLEELCVWLAPAVVMRALQCGVELWSPVSIVRVRVKVSPCFLPWYGWPLFLKQVLGLLF